MEPSNHRDCGYDPSRSVVSVGEDTNKEKKLHKGEVFGSKIEGAIEGLDSLGNMVSSCSTDQLFGSQNKVANEGLDSLGTTGTSCATYQLSGSKGKVTDEEPDLPHSKLASYNYVAPGSPGNMSESSATGQVGNMGESSATGQVFRSKQVNREISNSLGNMSESSATSLAFESQINAAIKKPNSPGCTGEPSAAGHAFRSEINVAVEEPDSPGSMGEFSTEGQLVGPQINFADEERDSPGIMGMGEFFDTGEEFSSQNQAANEELDSQRNMSMDESSDTGEEFGSQKQVANNEKPDSPGHMDMDKLFDTGEEFGSQNQVAYEEPDSPGSMGAYSDTYEFLPPIRHMSTSSAEYDVVFRYRKGDISNDFNCHLRAAFCRRGISVDENIDEVSTQAQTVDAVPECRVLILFLTSRYVPSNLANILEQLQRKDMVMFPIFDGISPSDYERCFLQDEPKRLWDALKETAQSPGYILTDKSESELIDEIVGDVSKVLCSTNKKNIIGIDMQVEEILSLLCIESPHLCSIGIWGTVGIGKTTIVEELCRRISSQYETCVFLADLHEKVELKGHDAVTEEILTKVLGVKPHVLSISDIKESFLRSRLQRKKVLIVLDDVNSFRDVETYLGKLKIFGPGSRIIITSRNRRVFVQTKVDHIYEVKPLDTSKSLLLLNCGTLQSVFSQEVYMPRLLELVKFANGNPQVLQFFGKEKSSISVSIWDWLSQQVQQASPTFIPHLFERSCCGLDDNEKSIFLDIACFFKKMDKDDVAMLLDGCGFSAHIGFRNLVDKSLLTISHNIVDMLRFIQATGREIVRQESANRPGNRSRLWDAKDIRDVFIDNTGTSATEGIFLDMSQLKFNANPNVFEKMCNLRLLKLYFLEVIENHGVYLPQGLEYLPSKLRLLHWEYYPISSLPQSFDPKNLVELNLPNSCVKKLWKGKKSLEKLKKMRLSYSYQLTKIPRLSRAPNLELLDLEGCSSLVNISQSICHLKKLVFLNLKDCSNLENVPSMVGLESLAVLNLFGCSKLDIFPEISPNVKELYLGGTMIQEIPPSIKNLVLLENLDLEDSRHLVNLPTSICKLKHLETLNLSGCSSLERFPDLSRKMKCLKSLDLSRTAIKELPSSISYLTALEELRVVECKSFVRLPDNAWSLRFKVEFRHIDTEKFSKLWNRLGWLKKVQVS